MLPLALAVVVTACEERGLDLPDDSLLVSQHFRYHARMRDPPPCPEVLSGLEAHYAEMRAFLGFPEQVIDYYLYRDENDMAQTSPCVALAACASGGTVHTTQEIHRHELIHAYLAVLGRPPALIEEGIATVISCGGFEGASGAPTTPWRDLFQVNVTHRKDELGPVTEVYVAGSRLTRWIIDSFGPERFVAFYGSARRGTADQFAHDFETCFGRSLDDVWAEEVAASKPGFLLCPCNGDPWPRDGVPVGLERTCTGGHRPLLVDQDQAHAIDFAGEGFSVWNCDRAGVSSLLDGIQTTSALVQIPAGSYFVAFPSDRPNPFPMPPEPRRLSIGPWRSLGTSCAATVPFVDTGAENLRISAPATGQVWYARILFPTKRRMYLGSGSTEMGAGVFACSKDCPSDLASCTLIPDYFSGGLDMEGEVVIAVQTANTPGRHQKVELSPAL